MSCGIPVIILTDICKQLTAEGFAALHATKSTKYVKTAKFYVQSKEHAERYKCTLFALLCHYTDGRQCEWDVFEQPRTYPYSTQKYRTTRKFPFSLRLSRKPPRSLTLAGAGSSLNEYNEIPPSEVNSLKQDFLFWMIRQSNVKSGKAPQEYQEYHSFRPNIVATFACNNCDTSAISSVSNLLSVSGLWCMWILS